MKIIYLFLDGCGIGPPDPEINPFARFGGKLLSEFARKEGGGPIVKLDHVRPGLLLRYTDATLGVEGLPQSASGQTALWTGLNGAKVMGHHATGFPGPTLAKLIHRYSIVKIFHDEGRKATLLNAYTDSYLERLALQPRLASASTHVQMAAGLAPLTLEHLQRGEAIYMDITHQFLHQLYPELKGRFARLDAAQRGRDLVGMAQKFDLVLFEYFLTDKVGHDRTLPGARAIIETLDQFLLAIFDAVDPTSTLVVVTSDHGNLEDLSTSAHTRNPVPTLLYGASAREAATSIHSLTDIVPTLYQLSGIDVELPESEELALRS